MGKKKKDEVGKVLTWTPPLCKLSIRLPSSTMSSLLARCGLRALTSTRNLAPLWSFNSGLHTGLPACGGHHWYPDAKYKQETAGKDWLVPEDVLKEYGADGRFDAVVESNWVPGEEVYQDKI